MRYKKLTQFQVGILWQELKEVFYSSLSLKQAYLCIFQTFFFFFPKAQLLCWVLSVQITVHGMSVLCRCA